MKYFSRDEFKCKCNNCNQDLIDFELVEVMDELRDAIEKPIIITSGNRCENHNKSIGGSPTSQHLLSKACDFKIEGFPTDEIYYFLDNIYHDKYGIGLYDSWVHIDVRKDKARWDKRS